MAATSSQAVPCDWHASPCPCDSSLGLYSAEEAIWQRLWWLIGTSTGFMRLSPFLAKSIMPSAWCTLLKPKIFRSSIAKLPGSKHLLKSHVRVSLFRVWMAWGMIYSPWKPLCMNVRLGHKWLWKICRRCLTLRKLKRWCQRFIQLPSSNCHQSFLIWFPFFSMQSSTEMYAKNLHRWLIPFFQRCDTHTPGSSRQLLRDYLVALAADDLTLCVKVFEASKANVSHAPLDCICLAVWIITNNPSFGSPSWGFLWSAMKQNSCHWLCNASMPAKGDSLVIVIENVFFWLFTSPPSWLVVFVLSVQCMYICRNDQISNCFGILECLPERDYGWVELRGCVTENLLCFLTTV